MMQKSYKSALVKSVDEVKKHTLRIKEEANQCMALRQANIDKNVDEILGKVGDLPEQIGEKIFQKLFILMESSPLFAMQERGE